MRNVLDKSCRENPNTNFVYNNPPHHESCAGFDIICQDMVKAEEMHSTSEIIQATNTHSEYLIFITFPPQKWLSERASM
jgi:hypothetical protein